MAADAIVAAVLALGVLHKGDAAVLCITREESRQHQGYGKIVLAIRRDIVEVRPEFLLAGNGIVGQPRPFPLQGQAVDLEGGHAEGGQELHALPEGGEIPPVQAILRSRGEAPLPAQGKGSLRRFLCPGHAPQPVVPAHAVKADAKLRLDAPLLELPQDFFIDQEAVGHDGGDENTGGEKRIHNLEEILPDKGLAPRQRHRPDPRRLHLPHDFHTVLVGKFVTLRRIHARRRRHIAVAAAGVATAGDGPVDSVQIAIRIDPVFLLLREGHGAVTFLQYARLGQIL